MPKLPSVVCGVVCSVVCGFLLLAVTAAGGAQSPGVQASRPAACIAPVPQTAPGRPSIGVSLRRLYDTLGSEALWLRPERRRADQALVLLRGARDHGLSPDHYRVDELAQRVYRLPASGDALLDADLSRSVLQMLTDIHFGRTAPDHVTTVSGWAPVPYDPVDALCGALREDRLAGLTQQAQPRIPLYQRVKLTLAQYRDLAARPRQGLPLAPLPASGAVVAGDRYQGAAMLRQRLVLLGDLAAGDDSGDGQHYSIELANAVRRFQARHGLADDGELGPATMAALAVPLAHRVRQLELTLERLRWVPALPPGKMVVVNLPAFRLWAFDTAAQPASAALEMRVIVGNAAGTPTPLLVAQMRQVQFQPYWNVPASIVRKEILPKLARDPAYLARQHMEIIARDGTLLAADQSDAAAALGSGRARIRQTPGPHNVLGAVKFNLPNSMNIYLHATSARELFARARRDLSHGCIRVEQPAELAEFVLDDPIQWSTERVRSAMLAGSSQTVGLKTPVPVVLFYATAVTDRHGRVLFAADIYRRDAKMIAAMAGSPGPGLR